MPFTPVARRYGGSSKVASILVLFYLCILGCERRTSAPAPDAGAPSASAQQERKHEQQSTPKEQTKLSQESSGATTSLTPQPGIASPGNDVAAKPSLTAVAHSLPFDPKVPPATALELRRESTELAKQLVERFPRNPDALEAKARFLMLFGESQQAKQCWLEAIDIDPNYAYALHGLGKIAVLESRFDEAADLFSRSLAGQTGVPEPVHDLAETYTTLGKLDEATETLRKFADANPQSALTWLLLGQAHQANQKFELAEQAFRRTLELAPGTERALKGLATVLVRLGKRDEAKQLLDQVRNLPGPTKNRAPDQVFQDEMKECSTRFGQVAEFYSAHRDLDQAERIAQRALVLNPQNLDAKVTLVKLYQQRGQLPQAMALLRELRLAEPENASWTFTLGVLLAQSGENKEAEENYREVIRIAPQSHTGYEALARLLIAQGRGGEQAIELAQQVLKLRGSAADHELLAQAYAIHGDYEEAEKSLQEAVRLDPSNANYAQAMQQLKKFLESRL